MINARRIITIVGTLFCALSAGFLMQHVLGSPEDREAAQAVQVASVSAADILTVANDADQEPVLAQTPETADPIEIEGASFVGGVPIPPRAVPHPEASPTPR